MGVNQPYLPRDAVFVITNLIAMIAWAIWFYSPNSLPQLEVTAISEISCGEDVNHPITSGYLRLPGGSMFWALIEAKEEARDKGLVIYFEGGPGASGMDLPFLGAGPCQLTPEGGSKLSPAPFPWTDHANLLIVDYPLPTGWSYNTTQQNPSNSSSAAAEDFDVFLQAVWNHFPQFANQPLVISTVSYGGTAAAHIASTVMEKNKAAGSFSSRVKKDIDSLVLGNPFMDIESVIRTDWRYLCDSDDPVLPPSSCTQLRIHMTPCLERLARLDPLSDSDISLSLRKDAKQYCQMPLETMWKDAYVNRYDRRKAPCWPLASCWWWMEALENLMNGEMRDILEVPDHIRWTYLGASHHYFDENADSMQAAASLLPAVIDAGTKIFVYSGMNDTVLPWDNAVHWMARLQIPGFDTFDRPPVSLPKTSLIKGVVHNPGEDVTLLGIPEAGHLAETDRPEVIWKIIEGSVGRSNWNPVLGV